MIITAIITGPGVPYYISVGAINEIGESVPATATVFTKAQSKSK